MRPGRGLKIGPLVPSRHPPDRSYFRNTSTGKFDGYSGEEITNTLLTEWKKIMDDSWALFIANIERLVKIEDCFEYMSFYQRHGHFSDERIVWKKINGKMVKHIFQLDKPRRLIA
jgi:hypothetical protein